MGSIALTRSGGLWELQGIALLYGKDNGLFLPIRFLEQPIGEAYQKLAHRVLIYYSFAASMVCGTFFIQAISGDPDFIIRHIAQVCALSLYLAGVFTGSHILADLATHRLHPGLAYKARSVGKQWLVLFAGLALGMLIYQGTIQELALVCGSEPYGLWQAPPWIVPLGCATIYAGFALVPLCQTDKNAKPKQRVQPQGESPPVRPAASAGTRQNRQARPRQISFSHNGDQVRLALESISHVTVEDHYLRVHYQDGKDGRELLVREPLRRLMGRIGSTGFIRIHRSHLVNKSHVTGHRKMGRRQWLLIGPAQTALPISRRKQGEIKKEVEMSNYFKG